MKNEGFTKVTLHPEGNVNVEVRRIHEYLYKIWSQFMLYYIQVHQVTQYFSNIPRFINQNVYFVPGSRDGKTTDNYRSFQMAA